MTTVSEIMTYNPLTVQSDTPLREIIRLMKVHHCRQLPVVDADKLIGIVTDRDVRVALNSPYILHERASDDMVFNEVTAEACMTPNPMTIAPGISVVAAARELQQHKFGALPVLDQGRLVGIISISDILKHYIEIVQSLEPDAV